jgi:hypothetical protein
MPDNKLMFELTTTEVSILQRTIMVQDIVVIRTCDQKLVIAPQDCNRYTIEKRFINKVDPPVKLECIRQYDFLTNMIKIIDGSNVVKVYNYDGLVVFKYKVTYQSI